MYYDDYEESDSSYTEISIERGQALTEQMSKLQDSINQLVKVGLAERIFELETFVNEFIKLGYESVDADDLVCLHDDAVKLMSRET